MNAVSRGTKNALRSPIRAGAIILMLAISITLVVSMLVARASINNKIDEVKATAGTNVTIAPAGVQGFMGGGDPLTSEQVSKIEETSHVTSIISSLSDQLGSDDTNLESALELGSFGQRQQRFESQPEDSSNSGADSMPNVPEGAESGRMTMGPRITVTGTTSPLATSTGTTLTLSGGEAVDGSGEALEAIIGTSLAEKNDLSVGDTFTLYEKTFTVNGIFDAGNQFQNSGIIIPLKTLQSLTDQSGAVTSVVATIDSSDNVAATVTSLKSTLGDKADITSQVEQAEQSVGSLESIANLALGSLIGAVIAGAVIILLSMIMIVRERRREIGVMKAIGGTNRSVITQFMSEALTLTIIGGLLGLVMGIAVSGPMTSSLISNNQNGSSASGSEPNTSERGSMRRFMGAEGPVGQAQRTIGDISTTVTPQVFTIAVGAILLIAILGSAIPAWFIANIKPASVLRSE